MKIHLLGHCSRWKAQCLGPGLRGKTPGPSPTHLSCKGKTLIFRLFQHPPSDPVIYKSHFAPIPTHPQDPSVSQRHRKKLYRTDQERMNPWETDTDCKDWTTWQRQCLQQLEEEMSRYQCKNTFKNLKNNMVAL